MITLVPYVQCPNQVNIIDQGYRSYDSLRFDTSWMYQDIGLLFTFMASIMNVSNTSLMVMAKRMSPRVFDIAQCKLDIFMLRS